jgi:hypothetical protein
MGERVLRERATLSEPDFALRMPLYLPQAFRGTESFGLFPGDCNDDSNCRATGAISRKMFGRP